MPIPRSLVFAFSVGAFITQVEAAANAGLFVERIEVAAELGSRLLFERPADVALRQALEEKLVAGEARLVGSSYLAAAADEESAASSGHEFIYPTEWDPQGMPQTLAGPIEVGTRLIVPPQPIAFETRVLGDTLRWEHGGFNAKRWLESELSVSTTHFVGTDDYGEPETPTTMPRMTTDGITGSILSRVDRIQLLAIHQPPLRPNRMVFVFGRVLLQVPPLRNGEKGHFNPFAPGAGDAPEPPELQVLLSAEMIDVAESVFAGVMADAPQITDWTSHRESIGALIDAGEAEMLASVSLRTVPGKSLRGNSMYEHIYPVSGDPPEIPQKITAPPRDMSPLITAKATTSTEMRPLGLWIDAKPNFEDGNIRLKIAVEHASLAREVEYGYEEGVVAMPVFDVMQAATVVEFGGGADILLAALTPHDPLTGDPRVGRRLLVFLRAEILGGGVQ